MKTWWSVLVAAGLVTACTGSGSAHPSSSAPSSPSPSRSTSQAAPAVLAPNTITSIQDALTTGTRSQLDAVLAPAVRVAYDKSPVRLLPPGSTVAVDPTLKSVHGDHAQVSAVVTTAGTSTTWTLLMARVSGSWLVYGTTR